MGETADQLREEIDAKRDDAAAKIDRIEARVFDTAQMARDTVDETVQQARDTVIETVETVKQSFDITHQVRERPWPTLGMAVAGGFLLGRILGGEEEEARFGESARASRYFTPQAGGSSSGQHAAGIRSGGADQGSVIGGLREAARNAGLDNAVSTLSGALIGVLSERIKDVVEQNFPELAEQMRRQTERQGDTGSTWTTTSSTGAGSSAAGASGRSPGYAPPSGSPGL